MRRLGVALVAMTMLAAAACSWETKDDEIATDVGDESTSSTTLAAPSTVSSTSVPATPSVNLDGLQLELTVVGEIEGPTDMTYKPGSKDLWVASKKGEVTKILVTESSRTGRVSFEVDWRPTLDITDRVLSESSEQGLLGIAFASDGRALFAAYTDEAGALVVERFEVSSTRETINEDTGTQVIRIEEPFPNHNGGSLVFGPDGFLYVGVGDGGLRDDPLGSGQDVNTLLGSILRLDVDTDEGGYAVPAGNPFAATDGAGEIYLYGVRNPWRFTFDRETGDLWIADVGQDQFEEINVLRESDGGGVGANLGWVFFEGDNAFGGEGEPPPDLVEPVFTYEHLDGECSVTGGYVYRGSRIPQLQGAYVYGDYCKSEVRALVVDENDAVVDERSLGIGITEFNLGAFGEGPDGEVYVLVLEEGLVARIDPVGDDASSEDDSDSS